MLGSVPAGGPALHGHRFDRYRLVVFEAVLAGEGEEGVDDCDPASGPGQFGLRRDRRDRAVYQGLGDLEPSVLVGRHYMLLRDHFPDRVVDSVAQGDLQDRREGREESGQVDSVQAVLHGGNWILVFHADRRVRA